MARGYPEEGYREMQGIEQMFKATARVIEGAVQSVASDASPPLARKISRAMRQLAATTDEVEECVEGTYRFQRQLGREEMGAPTSVRGLRFSRRGFKAADYETAAKKVAGAVRGLGGLVARVKRVQAGMGGYGKEGYANLARSLQRTEKIFSDLAYQLMRHA